LVFCLNSVNGNLLWQTSYPAKAVSSHGAGPRATPAIDENYVYTFGRSGDLICWNLFDGKEIWRKNVADEGGKEPSWGHSSSPLVLDNNVLVQGGGSARTIAYDKKTGKVAWRSGQGLAGYAALTRMNLSGKSAVLAFHGRGLAALDEDTGAELWNVPWETSYDVNATTPLVIDNKVFITSGYGKGCQLLKVGPTRAEILWKNDILSSIHSDPYVIKGYLYGYSGDSYQNKGAFKCLELSTGLEKWTTNEIGWGTCISVDDHLICCDIKGNIFLIKPSPEEFIKITEMKSALGNVKGPVWTMPIIANGLLYLRFKQRLVCYDLMNSNV
jgi:outer membrane protein assembly factor BamB